MKINGNNIQEETIPPASTKNSYFSKTLILSLITLQNGRQTMNRSNPPLSPSGAYLLPEGCHECWPEHRNTRNSIQAVQTLADSSVEKYCLRGHGQQSTPWWVGEEAAAAAGRMMETEEDVTRKKGKRMAAAPMSASVASGRLAGTAGVGRLRWCHLRLDAGRLVWAPCQSPCTLFMGRIEEIDQGGVSISSTQHIAWSMLKP